MIAGDTILRSPGSLAVAERESRSRAGIGVRGVNHLLSIEDLDREAIERIVEQASRFAEVSDREIKKVPALRGRMVLNLFYEASTRTRSSFELAAKRLSADVVNFVSSGSSVEKGESLKDTVLTLSAHKPDAIVIRTPWAGAAELVSSWTSAVDRQRRRRQARASDPGAARRVHTAASPRARSTGPRSGSSATSPIRVWRARTSSPFSAWGRR